MHKINDDKLELLKKKTKYVLSYLPTYLYTISGLLCAYVTVWFFTEQLFKKKV